MNLFRALVLLFLPFVLAGCGEQSANIVTPKTHVSGNLKFQYPGNWKITDDEGAEGYRYIFVESPGDAIVILQTFPTEGADNLLDHAKGFSSATVGATALGTITSTKFEELPAENGCERMREDFSISLLGQTVPHQRIYAAKSIGKLKVFLILQTPTEDQAKTEVGFALIAKTLDAEPGE